MEVINYLRTFGLQSLVDKYHLLTRRHGKYPNLVLLKYNQIESPMHEPLVRECRGLILDEKADWKVIARPFDKFWNVEDGHADQINWNDAVVYEKCDGTLCTLWFWDNAWHVSTSGSPDASGPVNNDSTMTFADLFWKTWNEKGYQFPNEANKRCYMFELMTPLNRIIVPHAESRLVSIGERGVDHQCRGGLFYPEHNHAISALLYGWEMAQHFSIRNAEEAMLAAKALNPMKQEGFVVVSEHPGTHPTGMGSFSRIKVKSPQYVALHHMKDGLSDRRMLEIVRTNEGPEFLVHFPEFQPIFDRIKQKYDLLVADIDQGYEQIKDIPVQKDFALKAQKMRCPSALFALRNGHAVSTKEFLASTALQALERYLSV